MSRHDDVVEENTVSRWFSHTSIDRAARLVVKMASDSIAGGQSGARQLFPSLAGSPLLIVAASFSSLQGRRHLADYAQDFDATRSATLADVDRAADAVDQAVEMWGSGDRTYHNFLLLAFALPVVRSR